MLSVLSLCLSLVSAINQLIIAKTFGASQDLNDYLVATSIPFFISGTLVVAFDYSLVPILLAQVKKRDFQTQRTSLSFTMLLFGVFISLFGFLITLLIFSNKTYPIAPLFFRNLYLAYLFCFTQIIIGYLKCAANAQFKFIVPFIASGLPNIIVILSCLFLAPYIGTTSILSGLILGNLFGIVVIISSLGRTAILTLPFRPILTSDTKTYFRSIPLILTGMLAFTVFSAVDVIWVPQLGETKLTYVNYCQKILATAGTLLIAGPSSILSPLLAQQIQDNSESVFLETVVKSARLAMLLSIFSVLYLITFSEQIVQLLFQRGNFTHADTLAVSSILPYFSAALLPLVIVVIIFRAIMARRDTRSAAMIGIICSSSYFVLSGILGYVFDLKGIGGAYFLCWIFALAGGTRLLWRANLNMLYSKNNLIFFSKLVSISLLDIMLLVIIKKYITITGFSTQIDTVIELVISFSLSCFFYVILINLIGIDERKLFKIPGLINMIK
jgi:putative peptidoglycan lipid II flippase